MLPRSARLRRSQDVSGTVRRGARAGRPLLVVHLDLGDPAAGPLEADAGRPRDLAPEHPSRPGPGPRAAFVVGRGVGGSVVRHRVARRLRHLVAPRLAALPEGSRLVVRALPPAATASSAALAADLDSALEAARRRGTRSRQPAAAAAGTPS
ncbi:MAG: ribonuclease P protein component [Frankiales bacterium]|nr:ribonuclease P protein component [Frankiales bacterium]